MSDEYDYEIQEAAEALVNKLLEIHKDPRYIAVWTLHMVHGGNYNGPNYEKELKALMAALGIKG